MARGESDQAGTAPREPQPERQMSRWTVPAKQGKFASLHERRPPRQPRAGPPARFPSCLRTPSSRPARSRRTDACLTTAVAVSTARSSANLAGRARQARPLPDAAPLLLRHQVPSGDAPPTHSLALRSKARRGSSNSCEAFLADHVCQLRQDVGVHWHQHPRARGGSSPKRSPEHGIPATLRR